MGGVGLLLLLMEVEGGEEFEGLVFEVAEETGGFGVVGEEGRGGRGGDQGEFGCLSGET